MAFNLQLYWDCGGLNRVEGAFDSQLYRGDSESNEDEGLTALGLRLYWDGGMNRDKGPIAFDLQLYLGVARSHTCFSSPLKFKS